MISESELIRERKAKRESYLKQGIAPYGERFLPLEPISQVLSQFSDGKRVRIAGRLMARRSHGKSTFCDLKDEGAKIQIYGKEDAIGPEEYARFGQLDIGDIVGLEGTLFL